jgi:anti-anti-sigma factor
MVDKEIVKESTTATIILRSDLVASSVPEIRGDLKQLLQEGVTRLVMDVSNVGIVDSVGIGCLVAAHNSLLKVGGSLSVVGPNEEIYELFRSMRLDRHFEIHPKGE